MLKKGLFAAGCFWGVQYYYDQVPGVTKTTVGYTGGYMENPKWEDLYTHKSGHAEAVLVEFDPKKTSYEMLVRQFFYLHDPTQLNRQGPDVGDQYRSAIFYFDGEQKKIAEKIKQDAQKVSDKPIVTEITEAGPFYEAEEFHQKFTEKTGHGMCHMAYKPL